jgi:CubicO group peptidase (beta-lactamase class C family)
MSRFSGRGARIAMLGAVAALVVLAVMFLRGPSFPEGGGPEPGPAKAAGPRELIRGREGLRQPRATPEAESVSPVALRAAADYAAAQASKAFIVSRHGHILIEEYWQGVDEATQLDAGAFGATVAALMVGVAMEDRKILTPDEPASYYVEEWAQGPWKAITIRQMLADPAGGQRLVTLIERAAGQRYASYVSRRLWKPLAANDAAVTLDEEGGSPRADCCFFARAADWMRVAQLLIDDGRYQGTRILPAGWAAQMLTLAIEPDRGFQLRLGVPRDGAYLSGEGESRLWVVPRLGLAILRMGDRPKGWDERRIPQLVLSGVLDSPKPPPDATDISVLVPHH